MDSPTIPTPTGPVSIMLRKRKASEITDETKTFCGQCAAMTGTILGLRALFHPDGFRHHTFIELKQSAEDGCYCCVFIENRLRSIPKRWDESSTLVFQSPFNSEKYTTYTDDEFEDAIEGQAARDNPQAGFACLDLYVTLNDPIHWSNRATSFFLYNNDCEWIDIEYHKAL